MISIVVTLLLSFWAFAAMVEHWKPNSEWHSSYDPGWPTISFLTVCAVTLAAGLCVGLSLAYTEITGTGALRIMDHGSARIVTLNDGLGQGGRLEGAFFLGIGSVVGESGTQIGYSWYQRQPNGALKGRVVSENAYNQVSVKEGDYTPHVEYRDTQDPCHTPWWVNPIHQLCSPIEYQREWTIFVPRGTVVRGLRLNGR